MSRHTTSSKGPAVTTGKAAKSARPAAAGPVRSPLTMAGAMGNQAFSRFLRSGAIQAKLEVGAADDPLEHEAERAETVVEHPPGAASEAPSVSMKRQPRTVPSIGDTELESELGAARTGGIGLSPGVRAGMESHLGTNFSGVRIHTGPRAAELNRRLGSLAFTHGPDIYFAEGRFDPNTPPGRRLLAHELTHVAQQGAAPALSRLIFRKVADAGQAPQTVDDVEQASQQKDEKEPESAPDAAAAKKAPKDEAPQDKGKVAEDAIPKGEEGSPKKAPVDAAKAEAAAKKKGAAAPRPASFRFSFSIGGVSLGSIGLGAAPEASLQAIPLETANRQPAAEKGSEHPEGDVHEAEGEAQEPEPAAPQPAPGEAPEPAAEAPIGEMKAAPAPTRAPAPKPEPESESPAPEAAEPAEADPEAQADLAGLPKDAFEDPPLAKPEPEQPPPDVEAPTVAEPSDPQAAQVEAAPPEPAPPEPPEPEAPHEIPEVAGPAGESGPATDSGPTAAPVVAEPAASEKPADACRKPDDAPPGPEGDTGGKCGGGNAIPEPQAAPIPEVSQSEPAEAMGAIASLPPARMQAALGGVSAAAAKSVAAQKAELAARPPEMDRPSGAPAQRDTTQPVVPPGLPPSKDKAAVDRAPTGQPVPVPQPTPVKLPAPLAIQPAPAQPKGDAPVSDADAARVQVAVENLPTTDPALNVDAGAPPKVTLEGDSDPQRAADQQARVDQATGDAREQGIGEVSQPMGEGDIYPTVPNEKLKANPEGEASEGPGVLDTLGACAKGGSAGLAALQGGNKEDEVASIVAAEKKGDSLRAAVSSAQGDMSGKKEENAQKIAQKKADSQQEIAGMVEESAGKQKDERTSARNDSLEFREGWNQEQSALTADATRDSAKATAEAHDKAVAEAGKANAEAAGHIAEGSEKASEARHDAESKARNEKRKAEKESGGFLGWLGSKVASFFDGIRSAIRATFELARTVVKAAIEAAKKLATGVIEAYRRTIVALIQVAGAVLIAIGDRVLAGFPKLRDKFRKKIQERVKAAVDTVNKLAELLKKGVQKALDLLGSALNAYLGLLECAYMAAVNLVADKIRDAIQFAKDVVKGFAEFAALIRDIAANPGTWLANLGAAVKDGLRYCFWSAFKAAVKEWFQSKVEEVLGLPVSLFQMLLQGCLKIADISKMAWEALKAAIPGVLIQLLIEKLVAAIVPAAGAILTIIEGLRAAWGTVSRIIAAIQKFVAFLKAVRPGRGAGPFAQTLASAGIVVIDFVANWLLQRLRKPASAVAGRLREIAKKIGAVLKRGAQAVKRGAKAVAQALKRGLKRGLAAAGRGLKKAGRYLAKTKVGQAAIRAYRAMRKKAQVLRDRFRKWNERRKQKKQDKKKDQKKETPQERLDRILARIEPKIGGLTDRGVPRLLLQLRLALWRSWYHMTELSLHVRGGVVDIDARVNPGKKIKLSSLSPILISRIVYDATKEFLEKNPKVGRALRKLAKGPSGKRVAAGTKKEPVEVGPGAGLAAAMVGLRSGLLKARKPRTAAKGPGPDRHFRHGRGKSAATIRETAPRRGATVSNQFVLLGTKAIPYADFPGHIRAIAKQTGKSPAAIIGSINRYARTGHLPPALRQHKELFAFVNHLPVIREGVRYHSAVSHVAMAGQLLEKGVLTPTDVYGTRAQAAALPMSMASPAPGRKIPKADDLSGSTPGAARKLAAIHEETATGTGGERAGELTRREASLVRKWILLQTKAKEPIYRDEEHARTDIARRVRRLLEQYFNARRARRRKP